MLSEKQKKDIDILYSQGNNCKEISATLELSYKQVYRYCCSLLEEHCLLCGKPIKQKPHKKHKKFCSDSCRIKWWNHNVTTRSPHHSQECEYCHKTFNCYRAGNRRFCSRECYANARRKE